MAKYRVEREPVVQPLDNSIKLVALTRGQVTLIDSNEYDWISRFPLSAYWHPRTNSFYAKASGLLLHRLIMRATKGQLVDHWNGNTLDNRKENLRFVTFTQNAQNRKVRWNCTSGYTGVQWRQDKNMWVASICKNGRRYYLGAFNKFEDAKNKRIAAEQELFGEFALSNRHTVTSSPHLSGR